MASNLRRLVSQASIEARRVWFDFVGETESQVSKGHNRVSSHDGVPIRSIGKCSEEYREMLFTERARNTHEFAESKGGRLHQDLRRESTSFIADNSNKDWTENTDESSSNDFLLCDLSNLSLVFSFHLLSHPKFSFDIFVFFGSASIDLGAVGIFLLLQSFLSICSSHTATECFGVHKQLESNVTERVKETS